MTTAQHSVGEQDFGTFDFEMGQGSKEEIPLPNTPGGPEAIPAAEMRDIDAISDPAAANRVAALVQQSDDHPVMRAEPEMEVSLLLGLVVDGKRHTNAVVREMNGADEEAISKSLTAGNITRFIDLIVHRAVESIGNLKGKELDRHLDELSVGDRDLLVLGVRRATYGDSIELREVTCPQCSESMTVRYDLRSTKEGGDVPIRGVDKCTGISDPGLRLFDVSLPSGKSATVKLLDGESQKLIFTPDNEGKNAGELHSLLLRECVKSIDGRPVRGMAHVRENLGMRDRHALTVFLLDNQPGPRYEEVVHECIECKSKFDLVLDVLTMFRYV